MSITELFKEANKAGDIVIAGKPITRMQEMPHTFGESTATVYRKMASNPDYPKPFEINSAGGLAFFTHELVDYYATLPRVDRYKGD